MVKLAFEGPDVHEECLYDILRVSPAFIRNVIFYLHIFSAALWKDTRHRFAYTRPSRVPAFLYHNIQTHPLSHNCAQRCAWIRVSVWSTLVVFKTRHHKITHNVSAAFTSTRYQKLVEQPPEDRVACYCLSVRHFNLHGMWDPFPSYFRRLGPSSCDIDIWPDTSSNGRG